MSSVFARLREGLPPVLWIFTATGLAMLVSFFGFFHWMPFAGVMFATLLLRPRREWPVWYVLFCCATLAQSVIVAYITYDGLSEMYARQGLSLLLIGNALHPLLAMAAVYHVQRLGLRVQQPMSLHGVILLLRGAALLAILLTLKDFAYIFTEGMVGDVRRGQIVDMQPIILPESLPVLLKFGLSHFMGAFIGVVLVVPLALWALVPANRPGSAHILRSFLVYLPLLPVLIYLGNTRIPGVRADLGGLVALLFLVVVVVFSFRHGWRGAALSVLAISGLNAYSDHLLGNAPDLLELQLTIAILSAMALLFGIGMDELHTSNAALQSDKARLRQALSALAESSRRNMEVEENERKRLGHELHDDLGQLLTAMELRMAAAGKNPDIEALESISERMRQSLASVVNALGPGDLNEAGLYEALANGSLRQLCELAGIRYQVRFQGNDDLWGRLSSATVLAAYRIVQEGVNNAVKYAQCRRVYVRLRIGQRSGSRDRILLMIDMRDDGVGLDEAAIRSGFHSIRDRALAFDGEVHISGRNGLRVHVLLRQ